MPARPTDWVIGRGLLGTAVAQELAPAPVFTAAITWSDPRQATSQLAAAAATFLQDQREPVRIYWCAGKGVTSASVEQIESEVHTFKSFLTSLEQIRPDHGISLFLASSVGGAYGGRNDPPYTESTPPIATSNYGEGKLAAEAAAAAWAKKTGDRAFVARITNLYGPGQDLDKGQGLISTILRSYITHTPSSVYVSLDTLRDYIFANDCARIVLAGTRRIEATAAGTTVSKIVGSGNAVSIGSVLGEIRRLRRSVAPIVIAQGPSVEWGRDLRVRSVVWPDLDALASTTLPAGIHETYSSLVARWAVG